MEDFRLFLNCLREKKWLIYVPERIYRAHWDGLLQGWGVESRNMRELLEIFRQQGISDIKIPFWPERFEKWEAEWFLDTYSDLISQREADSSQLMSQSFDSDFFWDLFLKHFGLIGHSVTNKILVAEDGWGHQVRFFTLWISVTKKGSKHLYDLIRAERREVSDVSRVLRKEYKLTSDYYNNRRATLIVLKKVYPPEQIRRLRRQLEDKIRKDPAEVIRYAFERGLLTK